jgi:hypothetical protein
VLDTVPLQGFQFRVGYPSEKGDFAGSADAVDCTTSAPVIFAKNDRDDGTLALAIVNVSAIGFPLHIDCTFEQVAGALLATDLVPKVDEVTANGTEGSVADLGITVSIQ